MPLAKGTLCSDYFRHLRTVRLALPSDFITASLAAKREANHSTGFLERLPEAIFIFDEASLQERLLLRHETLERGMLDEIDAVSADHAYILIEKASSPIVAKTHLSTSSTAITVSGCRRASFVRGDSWWYG